MTKSHKRVLNINYNGHLYYSDIDRDGQDISHFGGLPRVIISQGIIFSPKCAALRENIVLRENILAPQKRDISSIPVDICYIRWFNQNCMVLYDYHKVW